MIMQKILFTALTKCDVILNQPAGIEILWGVFGVFTNLQQDKFRNKRMHVVTYVKIRGGL